MRLPAIRPSLTWRFAIAALVTIALVGYVLTRLVGQVITDNALENARAEARDTLARRILNQLSPEDLAAPMTGERLADFQHFVEESVISERTARINIWNTEGRVIYSDDPDLIGRLFPIDDGRRAAFAGETVSELSHASEAEPSSAAEHGDLLEVYTPIIFPGSQEVVGAFEIYQVYGPVAQQIAETRRYVMFGLAGGLAVLYLTLVAIVHGGTRVIGRQHRELEDEITERRRANKALRESEERARSIIHTALDAFISIGADGVITAWNAQAETTFGWSRSEAVGRQLRDTIIPAQHREAHRRGLERFLETGEGPALNKRIEITACHRDGHEFPVQLEVWSVRSGETYTFNAFLHDITERKRAEEALRQSEELHRITLGSISDAVFISDGSGALIYICPNVEVIFGYSFEEVSAFGNISRLLGDGLFDPDELEGRREIANIEREIRDKAGNAHALLVSAKRVSIKGRTVLYTCRDITERKRAEEALQQAHTETVMMLAAAAEAHDRVTGLHLQGVRALSEALARELSYSEEDARELGLAAVLHDIGKICVPDSILASSGQLTNEERELMKHHTTWGEEFLTARPGLELAATIARCHHERWDGSGYPDGLAGDAIPEAATIVAVADAFDAITHDRPYRARCSPDQAVQEILACSGKQFSPEVVAALVQLHKRGALPLTPAPALDQKAAA